MAQRELVRVAEVHVGVRDPAATAAFLVDALDLHQTSAPDGERLTAEGEYGHLPPRSMLRLIHSDEELTLERVVFEFRGDADRRGLLVRLADHGVEHGTDESGSVIVESPDGVVIECRDRAAPLDEELAPSSIRPRRLGHVNLAVPDSKASAAFFTDVLGLALSEQVGEFLYFLRAGSDHHNLGLRGGAVRPTVHHVAFEVPGWETYRIICDRLAAIGHRVEYGPGRHGPGHNLFVYLVDPHSGLRIELYADMAHIDDDEHHIPKVWARGDRAITMNSWGPGPPDSFLN